MARMHCARKSSRMPCWSFCVCRPNSIPKAAAPDEFPQDRRRRHEGVGDTEETREERLHAPGFGILFVMRLDPRQQWLDEWLEHRQLEVERRVERDVGLVLKRENPLPLAAPHARPHLQRGQRAVAAEI